jgi:glutamate racemase
MCSTRLEVTLRAAPLLVPLVEEGWLEGPVPELAVERYVKPLLEDGARVIVLGCTHYPLLRPIVERVAERIVGAPVPVVDGAQATASHIAELMAEGRIAAKPGKSEGALELLVTDLPSGFQAVADLFLGAHTPNATQIDLTMG